jgi:hypothetical protein
MTYIILESNVFYFGIGLLLCLIIFTAQTLFFSREFVLAGLIAKLRGRRRSLVVDVDNTYKWECAKKQLGHLIFPKHIHEETPNSMSTGTDGPINILNRRLGLTPTPDVLRAVTALERAGYSNWAHAFLSYQQKFHKQDFDETVGKVLTKKDAEASEYFAAYDEYNKRIAERLLDPTNEGLDLNSDKFDAFSYNVATLFNWSGQVLDAYNSKQISEEERLDVERKDQKRFSDDVIKYGFALGMIIVCAAVAMVILQTIGSGAGTATTTTTTILNVTATTLQ